MLFSSKKTVSDDPEKWLRFHRNLGNPTTLGRIHALMFLACASQFPRVANLTML